MGRAAPNPRKTLAKPLSNPCQHLARPSPDTPLHPPARHRARAATRPPPPPTSFCLPPLSSLPHDHPPPSSLTPPSSLPPALGCPLASLPPPSSLPPALPPPSSLPPALGCRGGLRLRLTPREAARVMRAERGWAERGWAERGWAARRTRSRTSAHGASNPEMRCLAEHRAQHQGQEFTPGYSLFAERFTQLHSHSTRGEQYPRGKGKRGWASRGPGARGVYSVFYIPGILGRAE